MRAALFLMLAALPLAAQADRTLSVEASPDSIYFSEDGKTITAQSRDNHLRTWEVASGKVVSDKKVPAGSTLLSDKRYAERVGKSDIRIWDLTSDRQLYLLSGAAGGGMAMSPDGKAFASASNADRMARIFDLATGDQRHALPDGIGGSSAMTFSPDGSLLVSANYDNDVRIWKTRTGELVRKIEQLTGAMFAAEFTPDGKHLVMGGLDETIYILDSATFQPVKQLKGHGETISALAVSPDGRTIVTGGFDVITVKNPVRVLFWDAATGKILRTVKAPHQVVSLAFSPDGQWVAMTAGEKEISLLKVPASQ